MALMGKLPTLEGARIIIIDEGAEVMYAQSLTAAWLPVWRTKDPSRNIELLSFSAPKRAQENRPGTFATCGLKVHDLYTLDVTASPKEQDNVNKLQNVTSTMGPGSIVIIDSLSALVLYVGLAEACRFLDRLGMQVAQLICIHQRDFGQVRIPDVKTLGTSYLRLERSLGTRLNSNLVYEASLTHRKPGGGVLRQTELVEQNVASYEIRSEKIVAGEKLKAVEISSEGSAEKVRASFRIEMSALEMEQRRATPMPYTVPNHQLSQSKIHYEPDEVDDLDEEDPDDDLDF